MKKFALVILYLTVNVVVKAQCPSMDLGILQSLQRAGYDDKQQMIQNQGFDLRSAVEANGTTIRRYYRCWFTTSQEGNAIFNQVLLWNVNVNNLVFATLDRAEFDALRNSIESRQGNAGGNLDFYIGRVFSYRFGTQKIDGADYFSITIAMRE